MNALFAAGLFDNPWVVLAILIGGALANWVAKRRQEKQTGQPPEREEPSPPSSPPPGKFNLEETLRRLIGEEPPSAPAPPVIPRAARTELPPAQTWSEEKRLPPAPVRQPQQPTRPVLRPPIVVTPVNVTVLGISKEAEQAEQRFEKLTEQVRQPAKVVSHKRQLASRPRGAARWRDARSVREAFVASLVFAPPKSFEP